jgi:hypothetical protein
MTPEYTIKQWQQRNLPAPDANSHWTYMGGSYVLITEPKAKLSKFTMARSSISTNCRQISRKRNALRFSVHYG